MLYLGWLAEMAICAASSRVLKAQSLHQFMVATGCLTDSFTSEVMVFRPSRRSGLRNISRAAVPNVTAVDLAVRQKNGNARKCRAGTRPVKSPAVRLQ